MQAVREGFLKPAAAGRPCHRLAVFDYDTEAADPADAYAGWVGQPSLLWPQMSALQEARA